MSLMVKKEWFLYLMMNEKICRLNLDEFRRKSSPEPLFEVVHKFYDDEYNHTGDIPQGMQAAMVGSKVYMLGGQIFTGQDGGVHNFDVPDDDGEHNFDVPDDDGEHNFDVPDDDGEHNFDVPYDGGAPNFDVYSMDASGSCVEGPTLTIRRCANQSIDPRFFKQNDRRDPVVFSLEDKLYVLGCQSPSLFKVFDPLKQIWKNLPRPLYDELDDYFFNHCAWGHKLLVRAGRSGTYLFDTRKENWEAMDSSSSTEAFGFQAAVEFEGFLIGVQYGSFAAYELDTNGMPKQLHKDLHELKGIFCPFLLPYGIHMGKCDGGRIWVLYTGKDLMDSYFTRVAVFRVSISIDDAGNRLLSAKLEAAEFYYGLFEHGHNISSVFSICHNDPAGSRSVEEKIMCGGIIEHDHP